MSSTVGAVVARALLLLLGAVGHDGQVFELPLLYFRFELLDVLGAVDAKKSFTSSSNLRAILHTCFCFSLLKSLGAISLYGDNNKNNDNKSLVTRNGCQTFAKPNKNTIITRVFKMLTSKVSKSKILTHSLTDSPKQTNKPGKLKLWYPLYHRSIP